MEVASQGGCYEVSPRKSTFFPCCCSNDFLQRSGGLDEPGSVPWYLALSLLAAWLLTYLLICRGPSLFGKSRLKSLNSQNLMTATYEDLYYHMNTVMKISMCSWVCICATKSTYVIYNKCTKEPILRGPWLVIPPTYQRPHNLSLK